MDPGCPDRERFRVLAVLHESRFRHVLLLEDVQSGSRLAAHRISLPPTVAADAVHDRLLQVAALLETLDHARIPTFKEYLRVDPYFWCLFDYVEGPPLSQYEGSTTVSGRLMARWLGQILEIMQCLHVCGIIIGGITPSDLVVAKDGLHLVDVGYLEGLFPEAAAMARSPFRRTMLAPEERHSTRHSVAGDMYSAGAVAFWLITGTGPGSADLQASRRRTPVHERPVEGRMQNLLTLRPDLPLPAAEVIARLLQFKTQDRGGSAVDAMAPLSALEGLDEEPIPPPPQPFEPKWVAAHEVPAVAAAVPGADAKPAQTEVPGYTWREVPAPATLQDVVDDISLDASKAPPVYRFLLASVLIAILVGGVFGLKAVSTPREDVAVYHAPAVHVTSGRVLFCEKTRWQRVHDLTPPGMLVTDQDQGSTALSVEGGGSLQIPEPKTVLRLDELTEDRLSFAVVQGQVSVSTGERLRAALSFPGGSVVCRPHTLVSAVVNPDGAVVHVEEGYVNLTAGRQKDVVVSAPHTIRTYSKSPEPDIQ